MYSVIETFIDISSPFFARWKESVSRNQVLSEDLNQVKRDYERLQNQLAEERSKAGSKTKEDKKVKYESPFILEKIYKMYSFILCAPVLICVQ